MQPGTLRMADQKIGYGTHKLRNLQGEYVDYLDVKAAEETENRRTIRLVLSHVVANFALAGLDLALLFSFGGQTDDKLGLVEPTPSASLVFTLFVGLLCMPGALIHVLLAGTLLVDATMLTSNHKEKLAGLSNWSVYFPGGYFVLSAIIGLMLLTSQVAVYSSAFKVIYTLIAMFGIAMTYVLYKLRIRARERLAVAHVAPLRRDQLLLRPVLPR